MSETFKKIIETQASVYNACGFKAVDFIAEAESEEYHAHYYTLENKRVRFRVSKRTPTKTGQFVTVWKRMPNGVIGPYDESDDVDFFVISLMHENQIGQFIFPKSVLVEKNIFSKNSKGGKRAIRVYSPWDTVSSTQAIRTKKWQTQFFTEITPGSLVDIEQVKTLYSA